VGIVRYIPEASTLIAFAAHGLTSAELGALPPAPPAPVAVPMFRASPHRTVVIAVTQVPRLAGTDQFAATSTPNLARGDRRLPATPQIPVRLSVALLAGRASGLLARRRPTPEVNPGA
jgi:hypothetical protein